MEMTMIGPRNLTPAERKEMETIAAESQAAPDSEYRYFVHNPLDKTTHYYRSEARQQRAAAAILRSCCVDGDWDEAAVAQIAMGVVTHTPQRVVLQTEPQPADYADASAYTQAHDAWEEDCDEHGEVWTYRMLPLAAPGAGHESRADAIGVLKAAVWRQIATETRYEAASNGWVRAPCLFVTGTATGCNTFSAMRTIPISSVMTVPLSAICWPAVNCRRIPGAGAGH